MKRLNSCKIPLLTNGSGFFSTLFAIVFGAVCLSSAANPESIIIEAGSSTNLSINLTFETGENCIQSINANSFSLEGQDLNDRVIQALSKPVAQFTPTSGSTGVYTCGLSGYPSINRHAQIKLVKNGKKCLLAEVGTGPVVSLPVELHLAAGDDVAMQLEGKSREGIYGSEDRIRIFTDIINYSDDKGLLKSCKRSFRGPKISYTNLNNLSAQLGIPAGKILWVIINRPGPMPLVPIAHFIDLRAQMNTGGELGINFDNYDYNDSKGQSWVSELIEAFGKENVHVYSDSKISHPLISPQNIHYGVVPEMFKLQADLSEFQVFVIATKNEL